MNMTSTWISHPHGSHVIHSQATLSTAHVHFEMGFDAIYSVCEFESHLYSGRRWCGFWARGRYFGMHVAYWCWYSVMPGCKPAIPGIETRKQAGISTVSSSRACFLRRIPRCAALGAGFHDLNLAQPFHGATITAGSVRIEFGQTSWIAEF